MFRTGRVLLQRNEFEMRPCGGAHDPRFNPEPRRIELTPEQRALFRRTDKQDGMSMNKKNLADDFVLECHKRYMSGVALADVEMPCSVSTMIGRFKAMGLVYPNPHPASGRSHNATYTADQVAEWQRMRDSGMRLSQIAAQVGVAHSTVAKNTTPLPPTPPQPAAAEVPQVAAPEPPPADPPMQAKPPVDLARRGNVVIAARPLVVSPGKPYHPPQVMPVGAANVVAVAQVVGRLVEDLNRVPGVTASFRFGYSFEVS